MTDTKDPIEILLDNTVRNVGDKETARRRFLRLFKDMNPQQPGFTIIKVAGTNGKGSTCAMLEACLMAAGKRVGTFTSPHLVNTTERFRVDGADISLEELKLYAQKWLAYLDKYVRANNEEARPSFFEVLVLMALDIFAAYAVDFAIFEAGIGGYNDPVGALYGPLAAITSVGADHLARLGPALTDVAADKAGIASPGSRLILGPGIDDNLRDIIIADANQRDVTVVDARMDDLKTKSLGLDGLQIFSEDGQVYRIPLAGQFQTSNFTSVRGLLSSLVEIGLLESLDCLKGVKNTRWAARMEFFPGSPGWLLDVAHNPPAFEAATQAIDDLLPRERRILLYGAAQEKDYNGCIPFLPRIAAEIYLFDGFYRAVDAAELAKLLPDRMILKATFASAQDAVQNLRSIYQNTDKVIVVIGSVFMAGEIRNALLK